MLFSTICIGFCVWRCIISTSNAWVPPECVKNIFKHFPLGKLHYFTFLWGGIQEFFARSISKIFFELHHWQTWQKNVSSLSICFGKYCFIYLDRLPSRRRHCHIKNSCCRVTTLRCYKTFASLIHCKWRVPLRNLTPIYVCPQDLRAFFFYLGPQVFAPTIMLAWSIVPQKTNRDTYNIFSGFRPDL